MAKRFWVLYALLGMSICLPSFCQVGANTVPGLGLTQDQQQSAVPCTDALLLEGVNCSQTNAQIPQTQFPSQLGLPTTTRLGTVIPEQPMTIRQQFIADQSTLAPPDQPTEFQRFVAETLGQYLPIYGADLFRRVPSTFAPSEQTPVPSAYVVGPDDELRVRIWGQINFSGNLRVDRSGNIYLPQVGEVPVAGLQFSALDQHLRAAVAKLYRNFDLSVDIGQIRSIQVYVSGQARRPGAYTISSLSSLVDAIFATGGPSPQGSLRHILLKREGKVVADFDLYALLVHGDKSNDLRLFPEDVIYIPAAGAQVAIAGSVRTAAIYEMRSGETLRDLIELAGGKSSVASSSRIMLDRTANNAARQTVAISSDAGGLATVLRDGDILRVNPILPAYDKAVTLRGNVANPGRFEWRAGMRLSDLIPDIDALTSRDYWWKRSHLGLPGPEFEPMISSLGQNQQPLERTSLGFTTSVTQSTLTQALTQGLNQPPAQNQPQAQNQSLAQSQSPTPNAATAQSQSSGSLASALVQSPYAPTPQTGTATGPGAAPENNGTMMQRNGVQLSPDQINWNYAVVERVDPNSLKSTLVSFDLGRLVLQHDSTQNLELQPGDTVTIFSQSDIRVPLDDQVKYVELEGEVVHPGYYSVRPDETLRDVLNRAGGLTSKAYLYGSEFSRESTRMLQQQRLNDYLRDLTIEAERGTQALAISGSTSRNSADDVTASRAMTQEMIGRLMQIRATGRIVLQFSPDSARIDTVPTLFLENGDKFVVPFVPESVNIVGAVYDQNSFVYEKGRNLGYYLRQAGGPNHNADWKHAFVIRASGSVISHNHAPGTGYWRNSFQDLRIYPGDTIVVPDKTLRPTVLRGLIDWSQIFSQLALGAAAINVL